MLLSVVVMMIMIMIIRGTGDGDALDWSSLADELEAIEIDIGSTYGRTNNTNRTIYYRSSTNKTNAANDTTNNDTTNGR